MNKHFINNFLDFSKKLYENKEITNLKHPVSFEEIQLWGTLRWLPCRSYNVEAYLSKITEGCYFIYINEKNHPLFLIDNCKKEIVDFDNKDYRGSEFYKYLSDYPEVFNYIVKS